jgi:hypothetical protein
MTRVVRFAATILQRRATAAGNAVRIRARELIETIEKLFCGNAARRWKGDTWALGDGPTRPGGPRGFASRRRRGARANSLLPWRGVSRAPRRTRTARHAARRNRLGVRPLPPPAPWIEDDPLRGWLAVDSWLSGLLRDW